MEIQLFSMDGEEEVEELLDWSHLELVLPLNDTPTLRFRMPGMTKDESGETVPARSGRLLLSQGLDISVRFRFPGQDRGVEPPSCRFIVIQDDSDPAEDNSVKIECLGSDWDLDGMVPTDRRLFNNKDERWKFGSKSTPGGILAEYVRQGRLSGAGTLIECDFTASVDSNGKPWAHRLSMEFAPTVTARQVAESLASQGLLDWRFRGNTLQAYVADTEMRRELNAELIWGRDVDSLPQQRSISELAHTAVVWGEGSVRTIAEVATNRKRGRRIVVSQQGGITNVETAKTLAQATLDRSQNMREELTREYSFATAETLPFRDYQVGDVLWAPNLEGVLDKLRVYAVTILSADGVSLAGAVTLGDRFLEASVRQSRRIKGIVGGSTVAGGTQARPAPVLVDHTRQATPPRPPQGFTFDTSTYTPIGGRTQAQVTLSWTVATQDTSGNDLVEAVSRTALRGRRKGVGESWQGWGSQWGTTGSVRDLLPATEYEVQGCSTAGAKTSTWSEPYVFMTGGDKIPPQRPSAPVLSTQMGTVTARWDGLDFQGASEWPNDFDHILVLVDGVAWGRIHAEGDSVQIIGNPGERTLVEFVAVDKSGDKSPGNHTDILVASVLDDTGLDEALSKLNDDLQTLSAAMGDDEALQAALAELRQLSEAMQASEVRMNEAAEQLDALEADLLILEAYDGRLSEAEGALADLSTKQSTLTSDLGKLRTDLGDANAKLETARTDVQTALAGVRTARGDISSLRTDLDDTNAELETARTDVQTALAGVQTARGDISSLRTDLDDANAELETARADVQTALAGVQTAQGDISSLRTELGDANAKLKTARTDVQTALAGVQAAQGDISSLRTDLSDANAKLETARTDVKAALAGVKTAQGNISSLRTELDALSGDTGSLSGKLGELEAALSSIRSDVEAAKGLRDMTVSTSDPTDGAKGYEPGATWVRVSTTNRVFGQWRNTGTNTSATWVQYELGPNAIAADAILAKHIKAGEVTTAALAADAVTADKIAANAVTAEQIAANAVTANAIKADAVTAGKIAANAVTAEQIAANAVTANAIEAGAVTAGKIAANAVTAEQIAANAVTADAIKAGEVKTIALAADAVTADKIAANAVTADAIKASAVTAGKIAADAVTADKIAANAVAADAIKAGEVTTAALAADAVTASKIAANAVTADAIKADAVTADKIAADAVTANAIKAGEVKTIALAADAVTADKIAANAVTADAIKASAVTAGKIAADAVTADKIAANAVTADALAADAVTADKIAASAVTADALAADSVTANALAANSVTANAIKAGEVTAEAIAARSIGAEKMLIGPVNLIVDPEFADSQLRKSRLNRANAGCSLSTSSDIASTAFSVFFNEQSEVNAIFPLGSDPANAYIPTIPVSAGQTYRVGFGSIRGYVGQRWRMTANVKRADGSIAHIGMGGFQALPKTGANAGQYYSWTVPDDVVAVAPRIQVPSVSAGQFVRFEQPSMTLMSDHSLIVDGAILAGHLSSDSVTANAIAAGAVQAKQLDAGAVVAEKIAAGAVTADAIAARAVGAEKLTIRPGNLFLDPALTRADMWKTSAYWRPDGGMTGGGSLLVPSGERQRGTYVTSRPEFNAPIQPGNAYRTSVWFNPSEEITEANSVAIYQRWMDEGGAFIGGINNSGFNPAGTFAAGQWHQLSGTTGEAPAGATRLVFGLYVQAKHPGEVTFSDAAVQVMADASLIVDGSILAQHLSTDSVTANAIKAGEITTEHMKAGSIDADRIDAGTYRGQVISGATIISSDSDSLTAENVTISNRTIAVNRDDGEGGLESTVTLGGSTHDQLLMRPAGEALQTVTISGEDGSAGFAGGVSVDSLVVGGRALDEILWDYPRGMVVQHAFTGNSPRAGNADMGLARIDFDLESGRLYRVGLIGNLVGDASAGVVGALRRVNGESASATVKHDALRWFYARTGPNGGISVNWTEVVSGSTPASFLWTIRQSAGSNGVAMRGAGDPWRVFVEDLGPRGTGGTVTLTTAGGRVYEGEPDPPAAPAPPSKRTYTKTYRATSFRSWRGSGTITSDLGHGTYGGYRRTSQILFPAQVRTDLSGASNIKARVKLRNAHTWSHAGMTAYVGSGTQTSLASSAATSASNSTHKWKRGESKFVSIPWTTSSQSVWLGVGAPTGNEYYGKFSPSLSDCVLEVTYDK